MYIEYIFAFLKGPNNCVCKRVFEKGGWIIDLVRVGYKIHRYITSSAVRTFNNLSPR